LEVSKKKVTSVSDRSLMVRASNQTLD
jgi:hypothetical protein